MKLIAQRIDQLNKLFFFERELQFTGIGHGINGDVQIAPRLRIRKPRTVGVVKSTDAAVAKLREMPKYSNSSLFSIKPVPVKMA